MKQPICVDIDNVIARTDEVIRDVIKRCTNGRVNLRYEDIVEFDYWRCTDQVGGRLDKSEWEYVHTEFTRNHLHRVQPHENVQVNLSRLAEKFEIHVATSRLPAGHQTTYDWLQAHRIPFNKLHFVGHRKKHELAESFVVAIEDDREQAELFFERGIRPFLLAHPWNVTPIGSGLTRVGGWEALVEKVFDVLRY